jgi:acetolactate synthase regulatory subunit
MGFGCRPAWRRGGCPDQLNVRLSGDASIQMNTQELATCAEYGIPVKVFIMNNGYLGMSASGRSCSGTAATRTSTRAAGPISSSSPRPTGHGNALRDKATLVQDIKRALADPGPVVVDVRVTREENTYPMISPGAAAGTWWGEPGMGEPGTKERLSLEELEASVSLRSGRKHIVSILVENKPGVLTRISGLFARRGFNIDTLVVGPTDDEAFSRITLTLDGAMHPIDQVTKQLHKLVNVLKIRDLDPAETVARELAMFKIAADGARARRFSS